MTEDMEEESSVKSQEKILDELHDGEDKADMFYNNDVNQSRVSANVDISFFSDAGRVQGSNQQSFRSEREDDEDGDDDAFNFDALMKERVARQSILVLE